ncbi:MAG: LacI family DNA-binding transcriptional regulator [Chloroflexi bacterium]|nr:LacI family DNA-binding transcriptional regulator [Chloroflexota bacterium]
MATIKEIAQKAGVSVGTVSNYLNSPEKVAKKSSEAIQRVIEESSYHPRAAARSLKSDQTRTIGLVPVVSREDPQSVEPSDNAFLEFLAAVNSTATEKGYDVLLHSATPKVDEIPIYEKLVVGKNVDGILVLNTRPDDPRINFLLKMKFPFVSFGRSENKEHRAFIDVDGEYALIETVDYLTSLGHQLIAYICPKKGSMFSKVRWEGFSKAMVSHNLEIYDDYIIECDFSETSGQVAMHLLLDLPNPPTAVITASDICAFGAMHAISTRGLTPGKDISVVGFDNIRMASHWQPSLTTIAQPFRKLGSQATEMLIKIIEGDQTETQILFTPELVIRQSTGPAK